MSSLEECPPGSDQTQKVSLYTIPWITVASPVPSTTLFRDAYPDDGPLIDNLSEAHKVFHRLARTDRSVCTYRESIYVFVNSIGSWVHARSAAGYRQLADELGLREETLNFDVAMEPYIQFLDKVALPCQEIPASICLSSWRIAVKLIQAETGDTVECKLVGGLVDISRHLALKYKPMSGFCVMPIQIRTICETSRNFSQSAIEAVLSTLFEPESMAIIRWFVGNGILDPVRSGKVLYLYGEDAGSRSTAINSLVASLPGITHILSQDFMNGAGPLEHDELLKCMSSRFLFQNNVVVKDGQPSVAAWKFLTDEDIIVSGDTRGRLDCSLLLASDTIWNGCDLSKQPWFAKRVIAIRMTSPVKCVESLPSSFSDEEILSFLINSVRQRLKHNEYPPVGVSNAMLTIFGNRVAVATGAVSADTCTAAEGLAASQSVSQAGSIPYDTLIDQVSYTGDKLVGIHDEKRYILGLKPDRMRIDQYGRTIMY